MREKPSCSAAGCGNAMSKIKINKMGKINIIILAILIINNISYAIFLINNAGVQHAYVNRLSQSASLMKINDNKSAHVTLTLNQYFSQSIGK